jgi:hypothetical protein
MELTYQNFMDAMLLCHQYYVSHVRPLGNIIDEKVQFGPVPTIGVCFHALSHLTMHSISLYLSFPRREKGMWQKGFTMFEI